MKHVSATLLALCLPLVAQAKTCWEYRVIDTTNPPTEQFKGKAKNRSQAKEGLIAVLNQTGGEGWELVSQHQLRIFEQQSNLDAKAGSGEWVLRLEPEAALLRRETSCKG